MPEAAGTYVTDIGDGPPVLFIHALGLNTGMWALQVPVLAQRYRVLRIDVRGHGRTPYNGEELTISTLAGEVLAVLDKLEISRAAIVGISMGGVVAQQVAIEHPRRVAALALVSTVSVYSPEARSGLLGRTSVVEQQGMAPMVDPAIERWFTGDFRERAHAMPGNAHGEHTESGVVGAEGFEAAMIASIKRMILYCNPSGYAAVCKALAQADLTPALSSITAPALVMSGGLDPGISPASQDALIRGIANSTRVVLPQASHMLTVEFSDEFNSQLLNFLSWSHYL